jgi:hypothetical protein
MIPNPQGVVHDRQSGIHRTVKDEAAAIDNVQVVAASSR